MIEQKLRLGLIIWIKSGMFLDEATLSPIVSFLYEAIRAAKVIDV